MHTERVNMAARVGYSAPDVTRTNMPVVTASYTMLATDLGVVIATPGITVTLPAITKAIYGNVYSVKNISSASASIAPFGSDVFTTSAGVQTSEPIRSDVDLDFVPETTNATWVIY